VPRNGSFDWLGEEGSLGCHYACGMHIGGSGSNPDKQNQDALFCVRCGCVRRVKQSTQLDSLCLVCCLLSAKTPSFGAFLMVTDMTMEGSHRRSALVSSKCILRRTTRSLRGTLRHRNTIASYFALHLSMLCPTLKGNDAHRLRACAQGNQECHGCQIRGVGGATGGATE